MAAAGAAGGVYEAALSHPAIIGIVDGYFEVTPTVWHKEILWAMTQGIHVYGSASIGALRAAELHAFGMVGVGRIFEAFRDGIVEDDDEVAVLHGPEELGYLAVTEAMVNIRASLDAAVAEGVLDPALGVRLADIAKKMFYKERTWDAILRTGGGGSLSPSAGEKIAAWLANGRVDQKRLDALAMMDAISARFAAGIEPHSASYCLHKTGYHDAALWSIVGDRREGRRS